MAIAVTGVGLAVAGVQDVTGLLAARPGRAEPVDPVARLRRRGLRYKDRASQLALCAAVQALRDGKLLGEDSGLLVDGGRVAVVASSNLGNLDTVCRAAATLNEQTTDALSPMDLPNASSNVIASTVALEYGLRGPNLMLCNGPGSGLDAVYWAARLLTAGRCELVLVIGAEPGNDVVERLSGQPARQLFDGAVALVLEHAAAGTARGAAPVARLGRYAREAGLAACLQRLLGGAPGPALWLTGPVATSTAGTAAASTTPASTTGTGTAAASTAAASTAGSGTAGAAGGPAGAVRYDLTAVFGAASGALGVLQVAAAAGWFTRGGTGPALLTSAAGEGAADAGGAGDGVCGMLLQPAGAGPG